MPIAMHLDTVCRVSSAAPFRLLRCRSVLMLSGGKPAATAGAALRNQKLPPPWPRSNRTPRSRACHMIVGDGAVRCDDRELLGEDVGVHVAGSDVLQHQVGDTDAPAGAARNRP